MRRDSDPALNARIVPTADEMEKNHLQCEEEWRRKKVFVDCHPRMITIETTSVCNLDCVMCDHGLEKERRYEHFPSSLVPKLAEILPYAKVVQLHGLGEPLMNPDFWKILAMTHENQSVSINTNGILINRKNADALLDSPISEINFSLDAATESTYRKIRGAEFNRTLANIRHLVTERNRRGSARPSLFINMTLMRENIEEAADFVSLGAELGVGKVLMWHLNMIAPEKKWLVSRGDWVFDYHEQHLSNHPELSNKNLRLAAKRAKELEMNLELDGTRQLYYEETNEADEATPQIAHASSAPSEEGTADCYFPWSWFLVQQTGGVTPCCFGSNEHLGNLHIASAAQVWNGKGFRRLRKNAIANRVDEACAGGACRFVKGRPASELAKSKYKYLAKKYSSMAYASLKTLTRKLIGERVWAQARDVYRWTMGKSETMMDKVYTASHHIARSAEPLIAWRKARRRIKSFNPKQTLTRKDVITAYNFLLRRDPENEEAIEHHLRRCSTIEKLLDTITSSDEFRNLTKR